MRRRLVSAGTAALCLFASAEVASYIAGRFLQSKWCMYAVPKPPRERVQVDYQDYLRRRDPELGWPLPDQLGGALYDRYGARPSPAFPDATPETSGIALYGDSFTQSANPDAEAWGNVLAQLAGRPVSNYGQGGYGTDQAYLRWKRNTADRAPIVLLGHVAEDILRNLTRERDLLTYEMWYAYKPRFVLDAAGGLELVPIPALTEEEHLRLLGAQGPQLPLEHESFFPGGPAGATRLSFPFTAALVRNFGDFRMRARWARRPIYAEFYEPGHPLRGLEITREIFKAFAAGAKARGQQPLALLFPNREDVAGFRRSGAWTYGPLATELRASGVDFLDFGPLLAAHVGEGPLEEVYDASGHFNAATDRFLAECVLERLKTFEIWR